MSQLLPLVYLARHGETSALAPLLALATAPEPPEGSPQRAEWQGLAEYALEALAIHGAWRGLRLTLWRLLRCQPFHPGGYDPVPPKN